MIYFTSDSHFYHTNVIRFCARPFQTVEEMNEKMILIWNSIVKPEDTVYHLGDFSMAARSVELFVKRLNGYKILVAGNHDFVHPAHRKSKTPENREKWIQIYKNNGWNEVHVELDLDLPGVANVHMCHLPYADPDPNQDQRYLKYRPADEGKILLCGHVHEKWQTRFSAKGTLMINVGVDRNDFKPHSVDDIARIIKEAYANK